MDHGCEKHSLRSLTFFSVLPIGNRLNFIDHYDAELSKEASLNTQLGKSFSQAGCR